MIENEDISKRHAIPRWRSISHSVASGELSSATTVRPNPVREKIISTAKRQLQNDFIIKKLAWQAGGTAYEAEELLSSALVSGNEADNEVLSAAFFVSTDDKSADGMKQFALRTIDGLSVDSTQHLPIEEAMIRVEIAKRKKQLTLNPRDGLRLTETALLYANIGQFDASRRALERALLTHPDDRYVLRSAARFFTHIHEPEHAIKHLASSRRTQFDPWLSSALLATSSLADEPVKNWKTSKAILQNGAFGDFDKSELLAQIGSLEMEAGARTKSIKLLRRGAIDPTENAVAQIEWLGRKTMAFDPEELVTNLSISHEAMANAAFWHDDWSGSLSYCDEWQAVEPFSVRPAIFGSYVASISSSSLEQGIALANAGLRANPGETTLWNNIAVIKAYQGEINGAWEAFKNSTLGQSPQRFSSIALATSGLIEIRSGKVEEGISSYLQAIDKANEDKDPITVLRAYSFLSREVSRLDPTMRALSSSQIQKAINKFEIHNLRVPYDVRLLKSEIEEMQLDGEERSIRSLVGLELADRILN